MSEKVWLNGRIVPLSRAAIPVQDRGFLYGHAVFETVRIYDGEPFQWRAHQSRLRRSLARLSVPVPDDDLAEVTRRVSAANRRPEGAVRITVTGGTGEGLVPPPNATPTVLATSRPIPPGIEEKRADGVRVITLPFGRGRAGVTGGHKITDYLDAVQGRIQAAKKQADEALYLESDGALSEATTSNLFVIKRRRLMTPPLEANCLPGVTRSVVIRLARRLGIEVIERRLTLTQLHRADEAFLTGSVIEVLPIVRVDQTTIAAGTPGPITRRLQEAFAALTRRRA